MATSTFYDVDDANNRAFVDFSKNTTKKLVGATMKEDPATRSAILSVRMYGGNPEPEGRYRFVILRDGFRSGNFERLAALAPKAIGMSYAEYSQKATTPRKRTGQPPRVRAASTSADQPPVLAEGDIIQTGLMKISPDPAGDYFKMERDDWMPMQAQRVKDGAIKSWSVWAIRLPSGGSRPYDAVTTTIFKNLDAAPANPQFGAVAAKAHPNRSHAAIADRGRTVGTLVRSDMWHVLWP